ncbi:MAG: 50S ribosomal protein L13 [Candidatus Omnitrophota bacterium]
MTKTYIANAKEIKQKWHLIDARGKVLGHVAARAALLLRGKHKPIFTPHVNCGDSVVIINAKEILVTGAKMQDKLYKHYSGYPGGLKQVPLETMLKNKPEEVMRHAVKGMLPKGSLGRDMFRKLKVYAGSEYPDKAYGAKTVEVIQ